MEWPGLEIAVLNSDDSHCQEISKGVQADKIFMAVVLSPMS